VLRDSGTVECHGDDGLGEVGDGAAGPAVASPTPVVGLADAVEIAAAGHHTCARRATGDVVCWGEGPLGDGTSTSSATPVTVSGVSDAIGIATGTHDTCARVRTGGFYCWGDDTWGQLGDGATGVVRTSPVLVTLP
jgi:alpha-tubulin suppressor-like RCC1 family protein